MIPSIYPSVAAFRLVNQDAPKWAALEEAIHKAQGDARPYARSVRASLTYWTEETVPTDLVNSRMYQTIIVAGPTPVAVKIGKVQDLAAAGAYSETADTQTYEGETTGVTLEPGEVLAIAPDEAWAYGQNAPNALVHRVRVTLAGDLPHPFEETKR